MRLLLTWLALLLSPLLNAQFADRQHPRLWMNEADEKAISGVIRKDALAEKLHQALLKEAGIILNERPPEHIIHDGRRLLHESRLALKQISTTAWAWRLSGDQRYLKRALTDLEAACSMKDWNPSHFLDTAEMAVAVAIGYDWLYDQLSPEQRNMCERAIRDKALKPARQLYDADVWWSDGRNNWAQVCGGGIAVAAIAIQGKDDGLSAGLIREGLNLLKKCERFYAPDGVYPEGPGYWHYGTIYHVKLLAACKKLGHPVSITEDLERSAMSMIHLHGPSRLPFNFSDGRARVSSKSPAQAWIASHFRNPQQSEHVRHVITQALDPRNVEMAHYHSPLTLLWLPEAPKEVPTIPLHAVMHGEQSSAVFRSSWDKNASWLAIKGGTPDGGHGHMDVGSFCYDAHGMRWAHDLGGDNYNMPGYFRHKRFDYYRLQNRSHNTLEIANGLQDPESKPCPIIGFDTNKQHHVTLDLSAAYAKQAKKVIRKARFDPETGVAVIRDQVEQPSGSVTWRLITDAECKIEGDSVLMTKSGKSVRLKRLSKPGTWELREARPHQPIENPNNGFREVILKLAAKDTVTIEVEIRP
ncbi:MAG: heparinase II/III domain-containing protein [Luteolibacter sp.]